jgi:hypothetical protein
LEAAFDDESYVRMGARGTHVVILQQALLDAGRPLPKHGADGIFGPETHGAVKSYQDDRSLQVDGIVGPETMGDLDRLFADSPPHPDIPPGPLDICAILFEQEALADNDTLVSVQSLTPELRTAAEELPKVELPDGESAVECKTPSDKKGCADLCGCPLPSSSYKAKVGDLAQVMENATAFHEQDPKPSQDPRKLVCPPKGEPVKILKIIPSAGSGGITFLKVLFCSGPLPDKNGKMVSEVFIQQRFVENGKQLSIKGPNEIIMPNKITLTAEGAHPGSKPVWRIEHDNKSNGRAKFDGSNRKSSVKIEGTELSSLEGDVTVKVSVCDRSELHKLTVRKPFKPGLPVPPVPKTPPGPKKPPGSPPGYCEAIGDREVAKNRRLLTKLQLQAFISTFHSNNKDALELYMTYIDTPKTGAKGVLPPRRLFANEKSDFVKSFISDPETEKERKRIRKLIGDRVKNDPKLIPPEGKTTLLLPFRAVLADSEIMNLPMSFAEPTKRIPGFVAGGSGKDASDAGDDVRNADGQFRVTNQGGGTLRIQIKYIFDVHDAIDFCPGAHGGPAAWALTIPLSQLEATPDVPTYDTPFEVLYTLTDDIVI